MKFAWYEYWKSFITHNEVSNDQRFIFCSISNVNGVYRQQAVAHDIANVITRGLNKYLHRWMNSARQMPTRNQYQIHFRLQNTLEF
jgi:L-rhamnose isomerase